MFPPPKKGPFGGGTIIKCRLKRLLFTMKHDFGNQREL